MYTAEHGTIRPAGLIQARILLAPMDAGEDGNLSQAGRFVKAMEGRLDGDLLEHLQTFISSGVPDKWLGPREEAEEGDDGG